MALTGLPLQITSCSNRPGNSKEVILPSVTGKKLATTKEVKYGIITAIEWDARHFFWVLDKNGSLRDESSSSSVREIDEPTFHSSPTSTSAFKRAKEPLTAAPRQKKPRRSNESEIDSQANRHTDERVPVRHEARSSTTASTLSNVEQSTHSYAPEASSQTTSAPTDNHLAKQANLTARERILNEKLKILVCLLAVAITLALMDSPGEQDELLQIEERKSKAQD
ncbi:MAG: hypothetical protein L6R41_006955 [Letrouitia leprolyta]|nr:MAG: hypothetical protein L6R41_006955 [Letrouitia leprolyta]